MKEAFVNPDLSVTIKDSPVPKPGPNQVLIKAVAYGTNPKDWKYPYLNKKADNSGDDVAGTVEAVGDNVFEFKAGDRVAGYHTIGHPAGTFAEYSLVPVETTFHIPAKTSFEEAATIPLAAFTSAIALFHTLQLQSPWQSKSDQDSNTPLVIYGASTAIGAFAIKLASAAKIHPIIAVGSSSSNFLAEYLDASKGDKLVDYTAHKSPDALADAIKAAVPNGARAFHAYDTISDPKTTIPVLSKVLAGPAQEGTGLRPKITVILPGQDYSAADKSVDVELTYVGNIHNGGAAEYAFSTVWSALFSKGLQQGWLKPHPYEVIPNGLGGLADALKRLQQGSVRAKKLIGRVAETPN